MRIVATVKTMNELDELVRRQADVFLFESERFTKAAVFPLDDESLTEAISLSQAFGRKAYVKLDTIIHEADLDPLRKLLLRLKTADVAGVIGYDMTVIVVACEVGLQTKAIYQPGTFNTHRRGYDHLRALGVNKATLSREITFPEIQAIIWANPDLEFSLVGHGFVDMFYSKRKLLSLYHQHKFSEFAKDAFYQIGETTRKDELYPIIEDQAGTHIFRPRKLNSFPYLEYFQKHLGDFFINRFGMDDTEYYEAVTACKTGDDNAFGEKYKKGYDTGYFSALTSKAKGENI